MSLTDSGRRIARLVGASDRYALSFVLIGLALAGIGGYVIFDLNTAQRQVGQMYAGSVRGLDLVGELQYQIQEARRTLLYGLTTTDVNRQLEHVGRARASDAEVFALLSRGQALRVSPELDEGFRRLRQDWTDYLTNRDEVIASILEGDPNQAMQLNMESGVITFNRVRDSLGFIREQFYAEADRQLARVQSLFRDSLGKFAISLFLTLTFTVFAVRIVQRNKMLDAVRSSETRLREVVRSIDEGMLVINKNGCLQMWNQAAVRITGKTEDAVLGRPLSEVLPAAASSTLGEAIAQSQKVGVGATLKDLHLSDSAGDRAFVARVFPFEHGTTVFFRDAPVWPADPALPPRGLVEGTTEPPAVGDSQPAGPSNGVNPAKNAPPVVPTSGEWEYFISPAGRVLSCSPDFECHTGYPVQLLMENPGLLRELVVEEDRPLWDEKLSQSAEGKSSPRVQCRIRHSAGYFIWLEQTWEPVHDDNGKVQGTRICNRDITAWKRTELQTQKDLEAVAHLTRIAASSGLSASITHELNQPLTAILSNAQAIQQILTLDPPDLEEIREAVEDVVTDSLRAGEVIRRLRVLFKRSDLAKRRLDVNELAWETVHLLRNTMALQRISARLELDASVSPVLGDRVQLQQVLLNLLINAMDAMDGERQENKSLLIVSSRDAGNSVRLSVHDSGSGLTPEVMEQLFQPFFTTKKAGMGMGLSVARSIVVGHGGMLWATNNPDRGAAFHFTLPIAGEPTV